MAYLMGIDIGSSAIKGIVIDPGSGKIVALHSLPTPTSHPRAGWSEHDAEELWQAVAGCIRACAAGREIEALAISSMAEPGVALDARQQPLAPIIAWYDRRSEPQTAAIENAMPADKLYRITGQKVSPSFTATKLLWLRENQPDIFAAMHAWLPVPAWILYRLCGQAAIDQSIAARSLLYDQRSQCWSSEILAAVDLPAQILPPVYAGSTPVGPVRAAAAQETGLSTKTLCVLAGHDHLCAAFAVGAGQPGALVDSSGSASALTTVIEHFIEQPTLAQQGYACYPHVLPDQYILKGGLKAAGSAIAWLVDLLHGGGDRYASLEAVATKTAGSKKGPLWLPHWIGSGTPQGDRFARAALIGVDITDSSADLFRGLLEGLALWTRHNLDTMQSLIGTPLDHLILTGGAAGLDLLSTLKAAATNRTVLVPQLPETAAVGAAMLAGLGVRRFATPAEAQSALVYPTQIFTPNPRLVDWYAALYQDVYLPLYDALRPFSTALRDPAARPAPSVS